MNIFRCILFTLICSAFVQPVLSNEDASYMQWEDLYGRVFKAKLVHVGNVNIRLENESGKQIDFPLANLKPSSKKQAISWQQLQEARFKEQAIAEKEHTPSVFDKVLDGNLLILDGKRLKRFENEIAAEKYYIFYYTASWCPPCQQFTPTLVDWYKENKNDNFELILISSDRNEDAMESYAAKKMMPWPQLKLKDTKKFKSSHDHKVRGIPSLIVCKIDGENLGNYRSRLHDLRKLVR